MGTCSKAERTQRMAHMMRDYEEECLHTAAVALAPPWATARGNTHPQP